MTSIMSVPEEMSSYLTFFQNELSKPQFERFTEHTLSIIIDPKYTSNRINKHFFHKVNQSTSNRFLTESPWNDWEIETKMFQLIQSQSFLPKYKIAALDDTLSHKKYAKKTEGVGKHHDHLNNTFSNGHDIVSIGIHTEYGCIPLALKPYVKKKDILSHMEFKTKNTIADEAIEHIHDSIPLDIMTMDSWYGNNTDLLLSLKEKKIKYVAAIKSNRNFTINHKKQYVREYYRNLEKKDFKIYIEKKSKRRFRLHKAEGFMSKLGTITLLVSQMFDEKENKWIEPFYIITDLKNKSAIEILCLYLKRSSIESFHREAKQHLNLESYWLRSYKGIVRHLFLVVIAYVFLMLMMLNLKMKATIGEMCEYVNKCCETVSFHTVINMRKSLLFEGNNMQNLGLVV
ncbi:MAG: transposase [Candidatus Woesearchaeota archaeon]